MSEPYEKFIAGLRDSDALSAMRVRADKLERERDELLRALRFANDRLIVLERWQREVLVQETGDSITIGRTTFYRRKT